VFASRKNTCRSLNFVVGFFAPVFLVKRPILNYKEIMIITRTPFRISFFGGGTDYPVWLENNIGAVVSTTIDRYCYTSCRYLPPFFEHRSRIAYSRLEFVKSNDEIEHPAVNKILSFMGIKDGVDIHNFNDLPARSGIGSSSSFTVGLLHALYVLKGRKPSKKQLALDAIHVEQDLLKENVGCQDQVAAAFGGFNKIIFGGPSKMRIEPIALDLENLKFFQDHLMLFFTGHSRNASEIAAEQVKNTPQRTSELKTMLGMIDESIKILRGKNIEDFGKLLDEAWKLKRSLSSKITTPFIDEIYEAGKMAGALGGKLLGAGGGGFILFFTPPEYREKVKKELRKLLYIPFNFENEGSKVIYEQGKFD